MKKISKAAKVIVGTMAYPLVLGGKLIGTLWSCAVDLAVLPVTSMADTMDTVNKAAEEVENESAKKED